MGPPIPIRRPAPLRSAGVNAALAAVWTGGIWGALAVLCYAVAICVVIFGWIFIMMWAAPQSVLDQTWNSGMAAIHRVVFGYLWLWSLSLALALIGSAIVAVVGTRGQASRPTATASGPVTAGVLIGMVLAVLPIIVWVFTLSR